MAQGARTQTRKIVEQGLSQRLVGRMAAALYVMAGVGTFSSALLPAAPGMQPAGIMAVSVAATLLGLLVWHLPWERWSSRATLSLVPLAFFLIALGNHFAGAEPFRYGIYFIVAFTWIGFGHPRGTSLVFTPLLLMAYVVPLFTTGAVSPNAIASLLIVGPICIGIGESVAWVSGRLRAAEFNLQRMHSERYFRSLIQNSSDLVMILDDAGRIRFESPAVERVLGHRSGDRIGHSPLDVVHPDDTPAVQDALGLVVGSPGAEQRLDFRVQHADGSWHVVEAICTNLLADEHVSGVVVNYRDVTERKLLEERLQHQAFHDGLTDLANRALFTNRVEHALARLSRAPGALAVLFIDLDDFKTVNDSLGHGAGDELLVAVARRLGAAMRPSDTAARLGGDEFGVLLEDVAADEAQQIADRLLGGFREPLAIGRSQLVVHASIGIAVATGPRTTAVELLRNADIAMYSAKQRRKGGYQLFEPGMQRAAVRRLQIKADLERALDRGEFSLRYQPLVTLDSGEIRGVEALVRWEHPRRGVVLPAEFIGLAEESGLIVPIGRWVLGEACRQAQTWQHEGRPVLGLNVNLSAKQLLDPGLTADVADALAQSQLDPSLLTLEITETILMNDTDHTTATLERLKGLGARIAIDDFGTGYSSLSYLRRFPIDCLKIDQSFIAAIERGGEETAILSSILALSRTLNLETVAEGVENVIQATRLRAMGGDLAQGYYYARPLAAGDLAVLLQQGGAEGHLALPA